MRLAARSRKREALMTIHAEQIAAARAVDILAAAAGIVSASTPVSACSTAAAAAPGATSSRSS